MKYLILMGKLNDVISSLSCFKVDFIGGFDSYGYQPPQKSSHLQLQPLYTWVLNGFGLSPQFSPHKQDVAFTYLGLKGLLYCVALCTMSKQHFATFEVVYPLTETNAAGTPSSWLIFFIYLSCDVNLCWCVLVRYVFFWDSSTCHIVEYLSNLKSPFVAILLMIFW